MRLSAVFPGLCSDLEAFFGVSLADIEVRFDPHLSRHGVRALARGSQLVFAPAELGAKGDIDRALVAHEVAHVLQQRSGRVSPIQRTDELRHDPVLEQEADDAAVEFVQGRPWSQREHYGALGEYPTNAPWQAKKIKLDDDNKKSGSFSFGKNTYEKFLYDFELIQTWMTKPSKFRPALVHLNGVVKKTGELTAELHKREQEHSLNANQKAPIFTGVLSGSEFVAMNQLGVLPKDHVSPEHGEYTHRLQWYIVLYNATQGFTKATTAVFYNEPLSLLIASTAKDYRPPKSGWPEPAKDVYETTSWSMWEALFDRRPQDFFYTLMEDHISCPEMFTALLVSPSKEKRSGLFSYQEMALKVPDSDKHYSLAPDVPELSQIVADRYDKRAKETELLGQTEWPKWYGRRKTKQPLEEDISGSESDSDDETEYKFYEGNKGKSKSVLINKN